MRILAAIKKRFEEPDSEELIATEKIKSVFANLTSKSIYRDGNVELMKTETGVDTARVTIALLPKNSSVDLQSRGINQEQAANLRARLQSFAEDGNSPEMDVYDAL